jgi:hypothetical protein
MDTLLTLLAAQHHIVTADAAVIRQNYAAMDATPADIVDAVERRGHREFSQFTGPEGRA